MSGLRITVAGAGALGLASAVALAEAGCEVTVFDPAALANASAVAAGMIAPAFEATLDATAQPHFDLLLAGRDLWPQIEARYGVAIDRAGALAVGGAGHLGRAEEGLRRLGLHPTGLSRRALAELAPGLSPQWGEGLLTREDWRIDAGQALAALRAAAEGLGVRFEAREATGFEGADRLVIATGAARSLAVVAPELAKLSPIKGQLVRVGAAYEGLTVRGEGAYVAPLGGGLVLGATMEPGAADLGIDPERIAALRAAGERLFPHLAQAGVATPMAGIRAATPDGLPLVGRGRHHGVLLAVGARRNGWLLAPMAGRIIADLVTERDPGPYARRLEPARFG